MGALKVILNIVLIVLIIGLIIFGGFWAYQNYPRAAEVLEIKFSEFGLKTPEVVNASSELKQFVTNMRFNHNELKYFIEDSCQEDKRQRFLDALKIIEVETGIISFEEVNAETNSDIDVGCSKDSFETEENVFIAGEGGPTKYLNLSWYSIILKGKVMLYGKSSCDYPITELHELFHVFGFDHINNKSIIMYPYVDCKQRINPELIESLKILYSVAPASELYFSNASFIKTGVYLNFSVEIKNEGLIDAQDVLLDVKERNGEVIKTFELENISIGSTQKFYVSYLKLPSVNTREIDLLIKTNTKEFNQKNNLISVGI